MRTNYVFFLLIILAVLLTACGSSQTPAPTSTAEQTPTAAASQTPIPSATPTSTAEPTATTEPTPDPTATSTLTPTPAPTDTPTATPVPTYVKLRGKVNVDQAVCHYGPGAPYLYKYGVYKDSNLELIRRVELGNYVEIQAIGGNNPCWLKMDYLDIQGDWLNLEPVSAEEVKLPMSPYYGPLTGVSARRDGDQVTVFWHPLVLRPGDDSEQVPYLIEAWVCQDGQFVFTPLGAYQTALAITDEPGCASPSHGRVYAAEKHGYTRGVEIPWPTAETP